MHPIKMFNQRINKIDRLQYKIVSKFRKLKISICYLLLLVFVILVSTSAVAQPGDIIDSLITLKKEFKKQEKIEFRVKIDKKKSRKTYNLRQVSTMSCACGNSDFYYELYSIADPKYPNQRKAFYIHSEKPTDKQCLCKSGYKEFHENKVYFIPGINKTGNYLLIIRGFGFIMYSNVFAVVD